VYHAGARQQPSTDDVSLSQVAIVLALWGSAMFNDPTTVVVKLVDRPSPGTRMPATRFRQTCSMRLTLDLPDELSAALAASGDDISRAAFEAIALEAYRERKLTTAQLRRLLGFESRYELDGFLKRHEVWLEYTWQDLEQDREAHLVLIGQVELLSALYTEVLARLRQTNFRIDPSLLDRLLAADGRRKT